jgi:hypothetical protein
MEFSVITPSNISSIMAEIALAQAEGGANEAEGLTLPQELMDPEMLKELGLLGSLKGEGRSYSFFLEKESSLPQKFTDYLADIHRPLPQKNLDSKAADHHLSFKESLVREKELKVLEPNKQQLQKEETKSQESAFSKAHETVRHALQRATLLNKTLQTPVKEPSIFNINQQRPQMRPLETRAPHTVVQKEIRGQTTEPKRKEIEGRRENRQQREINQQAAMQRSDKKEDREDDEKKRKKEEEEGFAESGRDGNGQEQPKKEGNRKIKAEKIDETFAKEFANYAVEESILSEIFNMRVSQFDVLILFIEILKLDIKSREQEKLARREERTLQLLHMQNVVENYKSQGNWLMTASLGAGVLAIVSGACPIIGHVKGKWILEKLGSVFSSLQNMEKDKFFKGITKMTFAMSEMQKSTGQIHQTFSEGSRTFDQHMSDLHRTDWEENTRSIEEIKDSWKGIENFLYQALQMYHDTIRQLYSH